MMTFSLEEEANQNHPCAHALPPPLPSTRQISEHLVAPPVKKLVHPWFIRCLNTDNLFFPWPGKSSSLADSMIHEQFRWRVERSVQYLGLPRVDGALSVETSQVRLPGSRVPAGGRGAGCDAVVLDLPALHAQGHRAACTEGSEVTQVPHSCVIQCRQN